MTGQTISHYRILEKLGSGGMGVVYKAQDTILNRFVALKLLSESLTSNKEAAARFLREAQAAAALNHPNICTVHEIGEADGQTFIAMAFIEGESLDRKIAAGPLPIPQAVDFARQVAQGLDAAHKKGIFHRDVKPGNLIVGEGDRITLVDFGVAQLAHASRLTNQNATLGTVAYMAPEQVEGSGADHRIDLWSLGVVLYEMVSGQVPFAGDYSQAVMYGIKSEDPKPLTGLRTGVPMELEWVVGKCLEKNPAQRYQHADELVVDLESLRDQLKSGKSRILGNTSAGTLTTTASDPPAATASQQTAAGRLHATAAAAPPSTTLAEVVPSVDRRRGLLRALVGLVAAALLIWALALAPGPAPESAGPTRRFNVFPPVPVGGSPAPVYSNVAISPNGRHIAYSDSSAGGRLWVQDLDRREPRSFGGTEGAFAPFWSPDSSYIAFAAAADLKKISVDGGLPIRVATLPSGLFLGGTWSPDGEVIVVSSQYPPSLYQIPAGGGDPQLVIAPGDSADASTAGPAPIGEIVWPHFLPAAAGRRVVLFAFGTASRTMMVQDLDSGHRETLGPGTFPAYSPSGHIVHQRATLTYDLWALPFSLDTLEATGESFPVTENGRGPSLADDQTLVYLDGPGADESRLVWLDREGKRVEEIGLVAGHPNYPALSPDDRFVAVMGRQGENEDIWVYDTARGVRTRVSDAPGRDYRPAWAPGDRGVAYSAVREGSSVDIYLRSADGISQERRLADGPATERVCDWSRDGRYVLYRIDGDQTGSDLWYLERDEDGENWEPRPYLQSRFEERSGAFSPDGRYVAYVSSESGSYEVYVRAFPQGDFRTTVSTNGGKTPRWSANGRELFYLEDSTMVAVPVRRNGDSIALGSAERLFEHPVLSSKSSYHQFDVSGDGQRFVISEPADPAAEPSIQVVQNWFAEFR